MNIVLVFTNILFFLFCLQCEVNVNLTHVKMEGLVMMLVLGTSVHAHLVSKEVHVKVR